MFEILVTHQEFDNATIDGAIITAPQPGLYLIFPQLDEESKSFIAEMDTFTFALTWESE